jgi:threonine synthase
MQLYNTRNHNQRVTLEDAVFNGLASDGGLFLPCSWPRFSQAKVAELLREDFITRSVLIAQEILADEFTADEAANLVTDSFTFPVPLVQVDKNRFALELFHGPTLAFKDFGARFLARTMLTLHKRAARSNRDRLCTILTATSGDTGAAVADAFHNLEGVAVRILYPRGGISPLQEKMFCTLGGNVKTYAVDGSFDDCQQLVKSCFQDGSLRKKLGLTSANSINIARLLGQVFYYFEAAARSPQSATVVAVPSGNFGNLTAGLMAQSLGAPIKRFVAATNNNDTIPRLIREGVMAPRPTVATLSNAMDVSRPNNWERIETLFSGNLTEIRKAMSAVAIDEPTTIASVRALRKEGYLACPHTAVALRALEIELERGETGSVGIALATAHPAKFQESLEGLLAEAVSLPPRLEQARKALVLSEALPNSVESLKARLIDSL